MPIRPKGSPAEFASYLRRNPSARSQLSNIVARLESALADVEIQQRLERLIEAEVQKRLRAREEISDA